jgi:Skp family chaperone for outer membrane proteins
MESINPETIHPETSGNAVSVFGASNDVNDFPVLKAFQQYIDAEQAKARKRMLGLAVFFVVLLSLVVITFTIIVMNVSQRNQDLSDRLLDIALRERSSQPVVNVQPQAPVVQQPSPETYMKPFLEKLENLTKAVAEQKQQPVAPAPIVVAPQMTPAQTESEETKKLKEELKKLQKRIDEEKAVREAEKKEEERLRKVEEHRRRLYPEYYAPRANTSNAPVTAPAQTQFVKPITSLPAARPSTAPVQQQKFVAPITTLPAANVQQPPAPVAPKKTTVPQKSTSLIKDVDRELQALVDNAQPKKDTREKETSQAPAIAPQPAKSETLNVGDGVQMFLPL